MRGETPDPEGPGRLLHGGDNRVSRRFVTVVMAALVAAVVVAGAGFVVVTGTLFGSGPGSVVVGGLAVVGGLVPVVGAGRPGMVVFR